MVKKQGKPSERRIHNYAILVILSESREPQCFDDLVGISRLKRKVIISEVGVLLKQNYIKKIRKEKNYFEITKSGRNRLKWFRQNKNYENYWLAPWEKRYAKWNQATRSY